MPVGFRNLIEKGLKVLNIIAQTATNNKTNIMLKETVTLQCEATFAFSHFKSNLNCNKFANIHIKLELYVYAKNTLEFTYTHTYYICMFISFRR